MHLARYGDLEAARRLAEPGKSDIFRQIEACAYERKYPAEWTRLTAFMLQSAEFRVATGDKDGIRDLLSLHCQLREVLDAKAARGQLGAALLSRGRKTLTLAVAALEKEKNSELAEQIRNRAGCLGRSAVSPQTRDTRHGPRPPCRAHERPEYGPRRACR